MIFRAALLAASLFTFSCLPASGGGAAHAVPVGAYGGEHLALTVRADGADFEFDCATGHVRTPLTVDRHGKFRVNGTYQRESPARTSTSDAPQDEGTPVTYSGKLDGNELEITVILPGTDQPSVFHVVRDRDPRLTKCM